MLVWFLWCWSNFRGPDAVLESFYPFFLCCLSVLAMLLQFCGCLSSFGATCAVLGVLMHFYQHVPSFLGMLLQLLAVTPPDQEPSWSNSPFPLFSPSPTVSTITFYQVAFHSFWAFQCFLLMPGVPSCCWGALPSFQHDLCHLNPTLYRAKSFLLA